MKQRFSAFTLIEVVVALTLFSFVIIGVLLVVTRAYRYVENSKMQVMAVNLAREGIEMIYNIRDTNWRKYSGAKDINWLRRDPFGGSTDLITEGYYTLDMKLYSDQQYSTLTKIESVNEDVLSGLYVDISSYLDTTAANTFKVAFTGGYYSGTTLVASADDLMSKEADFYRIVYVNGLYSKKS
jgi:Tfp pilus assembly protein PilV